jgi:sortase (surface protein transpeptidase)
VLLASGIGAIALGVGGWALATQSGAWRVETRATGHVPHVRAPAGRAAHLPGPSGRPKVARPVRLVIPVIGVRTHLVRLGLTSAGTLQVPASAAVAGWFSKSPRPGALGASIIAGHIDSRSGPGVFFRLRDLRRGQFVYVTRANRTVARFRVTAVRQYAKVHFPAAHVYGPVPDAELRLITCGGTFDYATGSYLSNVVVYAVLVR